MFVDGDTFNGPIRTDLASVLYCGTPEFLRVEVAADSTANALVPAAGCPPTANTQMARR